MQYTNTGRQHEADHTYVVHAVRPMDRMQYHINSHASCVSCIPLIAIRAHLVPQQPGLLGVADAICISHIE